MWRCVEEIEEDEISRTVHNRQYLKLTSGIVLPNLGWLIFGSYVAISSLDPPPSHDLNGPGNYDESYCYWGLWRLFHAALILSAGLILISFSILIYISCQLRHSHRSNRNRESSWAGYKNGQRAHSLKSYTEPKRVTDINDPFDTNRY